jgi:hypothetical protein
VRGDGFYHYYRLPKRGWSDRYRLLIEAAKVIGLAALFVACLVAVYVYIVVLAP